MPTAYSYIRFSSGKQAKGSSRERQQSMVMDWLSTHPDYALSDARYEDLGRSGFKGEHLEHGLGKLRAAVEGGFIKSGDVVLVEAVDRIGRLDPHDMMHLVRCILDFGVVIITLDDGIQYTRESISNDHLFLLAAKTQQAHKYSETLSRRITGSYQARRLKAKSGIPVKRSFPLWLDKEGQVIEDLAPFIVQAFSDYADGLGERRIYDRIRGKHPLLESINPSTIKRWMTNNTAIGAWGDIPNAHPAVISQELWYRVQQRNNQLSPTAKAAPTKHLLTGLVKCAHCGANYIYRKLSKSPPVMGCGRRARLGGKEFGGCENKTNIPVQILDFVRVDSSFQYVKEALAGQQLSQNEKDLLVVKGKLDEVSTSISAISEAIAAVGSFTPELQEKLQALAEQRKELETKAAILERAPAQSNISLVDLANAELDLLERDPIRLNALLQGVQYALFVNIDKEIAVGVAADIVYQYQGARSGWYGLKMPLQENNIKLRILAPGEQYKQSEHNKGFITPLEGEMVGLTLLRMQNARRARMHH